VRARAIIVARTPRRSLTFTLIKHALNPHHFHRFILARIVRIVTAPQLVCIPIPRLHVQSNNENHQPQLHHTSKQTNPTYEYNVNHINRQFELLFSLKSSFAAPCRHHRGAVCSAVVSTPILINRVLTLECRVLEDFSFLECDALDCIDANRCVRRINVLHVIPLENRVIQSLISLHLNQI
jgi:hypothetical protein